MTVAWRGWLGTTHSHEPVVPTVPPRPPTAKMTAELELRAAAFQTYLDQVYALTAGAVDRYRAAAATVQTAAAALGVLYTGALALVFGEGEGGLPARGLLAPFFLAVAVGGATWYLASVGPRKQPTYRPPALAGDGVRVDAVTQVGDFRAQVLYVVLQRLGVLRTGVAALALALVFAPAAFMQPAGDETADVGPAWPAVPTATGDAELARYEAELAETATLRAAARESSADFVTSTDGWWFAAGGLAVAGLVAVGTVTARRRDQVLADLDTRAKDLGY